MSVQSNRSSKRRISSCNVITKYFRHSSELNVSGSESTSESSDHPGTSPVVIVIESDDESTDTEDSMSIKPTHSSRSIAASIRDTVVNAVPNTSVGSEVAGCDPEAIPSQNTSEQLSHIQSRTISYDTNSESSAKAMKINDIGLVIQEGMSVEEITSAVLALTPSQKYLLLTKHFKPDKGFLFPKIYSNGCNRSFQLSWLEKYPWLVYSKEVDGGFCKYCTLFVKNRSSLGALVNWPFRKWIKVNKIVEGHKDALYHKSAIECAVDFRQSINQN